MKQPLKLRLSKKKRFVPLFLLMFPGLLYLSINNYIPMFGLFIAFKDINFAQGIWGSDWVGFRNFEYLFSTRDAWVITRNTILYNSAFIVFTMVAALALAILLNEVKNKLLARFYQSVVLLPYLISMVIISYLVFAVFSTRTGLMNQTILPLLGLDQVSWYTEAMHWPWILTSVKVWNDVGFFTVILFAAVIGISNEYYEAAKLDGATKWQQIRYITLPSIAPVIVMLVLIGIGKIFYSDFGLFYVVPMDSGPLYSTTNVIDTYVFRGLMQLGDISMSAAAGFYQSIVGFVLVVISNWLVRRKNKENALF
ncbi:ABC transporter permease subunit [Alkalihalobacillus sp. MEB130]|uniref:ABC transporter permease n=1 Tax=Alkalihalobacillus sp. MEB130 TaxID=2976704 RepID=UPI0028DE4A8F|nr:ABC transporter permease subunit [Alkalihalobacillus sp. MEB130]MDT8860205.1 ABC transporter permease subunit [Alkalihalobacillus sp. MEB130]